MSENKETSTNSMNNFADSFKKFTTSAISDAGAAFSRLNQKIEETLGTSEVTPLESTVETLLARSEAVKKATDLILSNVEAVIEPNPAQRYTQKLFSKIDVKTSAKTSTSLSELANSLQVGGASLTQASTYGKSLQTCATCMKTASDLEMKLNDDLTEKFVKPMHALLDVEYDKIMVTKKHLMDVRLDLDSAKTKLKRSSEDSALASECRRLNSQFDTVNNQLKTILEDFCGVAGQKKLSDLIVVLEEVFNDYYSKCGAAFTKTS